MAGVLYLLGELLDGAKEWLLKHTARERLVTESIKNPAVSGCASHGLYSAVALFPIIDVQGREDMEPFHGSLIRRYCPSR